MKCLVVGGAGYLGGALTDLLFLHEVRVYDNLTYEDNYLKPIEFVRGDIRDHKALKEQLAWADAVIWLAALVGDGACAINPELTKEINQDSVKWLSQNFDGRIVFMSTCSVYGAQEGELTEDSPTDPLSIYAKTKLEAEGYLKDSDAIIFRLGTLFGLGDTYARTRLDLVVNTLTVRAHSEGKLTVFGGEQYRPLLHVKDAARAIVEALENGHRGIFNLHTENIRILDLAERVRNHIPCTVKTVETSFQDSRNYRANSNKANWFVPAYTVDDGIIEVQTLLDEGRIKDLNNPRYTNQKYLEVFHDRG